VNVFQGIGSAVPILLLTVAQVFGQNPGTSVEIDLEEQTAYLLHNGRPVLATPISSGRYGHLTERGSFKILDKERTHYSSMYGKIVDARGNTIVADADADMRVLREGNSFLRQCITLCASAAQTECTPAICQGTLRRTAASACRKNTRLQFSTPSASELQ
jgi:hypothetical protein